MLTLSDQISGRAVALKNGPPQKAGYCKVNNNKTETYTWSGTSSHVSLNLSVDIDGGRIWNT